MKELALNDITPELTATTSRGESTEGFGMVVRVGNQPLSFPLRSAFKTLKVPVPAELPRKYEVLMVPHRISVERKFGLHEPVEVGIEAEYLVDGDWCSIQGLLPAAQFITHGSLNIQGQIEGSGVMSAGSPGHQEGPALDRSGLFLRAGSASRLSFRFGADVCTPIISSSGLGSNTCRWTFFKHDQPLFGKDIETWAAVVREKKEAPIRYRIKSHVLVRAVLWTKRLETEWETLEARTA
jgi:hypothetical protein